MILKTKDWLDNQGLNLFRLSGLKWLIPGVNQITDEGLNLFRLSGLK